MNNTGEQNSRNYYYYYYYDVRRIRQSYACGRRSHDTRLWLGPVGKWSERESRTRGLTADPTQHLPADAVADLWSESTD